MTSFLPAPRRVRLILQLESHSLKTSGVLGAARAPRDRRRRPSRGNPPAAEDAAISPCLRSSCWNRRLFAQSPAAPHQFERPRCCERRREQEPLHLVAAEVRDGTQLFLILDSLRQHSKSQLAGERDYSSDDGAVAMIAGHTRREGFVDFQAVDRQLR